MSDAFEVLPVVGLRKVYGAVSAIGAQVRFLGNSYGLKRLRERIAPLIGQRRRTQ